VTTIGAVQKNGGTPLLSAPWYGDLKMLQVLLDKKVNVNAQGHDN
jgi:ankyrin repeat protein